ncbi:hypothetical protein E4U41_004277, partial [Claviceps citrina]
SNGDQGGDVGAAVAADTSRRGRCDSINSGRLSRSRLYLDPASAASPIAFTPPPPVFTFPRNRLICYNSSQNRRIAESQIQDRMLLELAEGTDRISE